MERFFGFVYSHFHLNSIYRLNRTSAEKCQEPKSCRWQESSRLRVLHWNSRMQKMFSSSFYFQRKVRRGWNGTREKSEKQVIFFHSSLEQKINLQEEFSENRVLWKCWDFELKSLNAGLLIPGEVSWKRQANRSNGAQQSLHRIGTKCVVSLLLVGLKLALQGLMEYSLTWKIFC